MAWNNNGWMAAEVRGVLSGLHFGVSRSWGGTRFAPRGTNERYRQWGEGATGAGKILCRGT